MNKQLYQWLNHVPIRTRLALAYLVTLAVILIIFVTFIYLRVQNDLLAQMDTTLELAAIQAMAVVDPDEAYLSFENVEITRDTLQRLGGFSVHLLDTEGLILDHLGGENQNSPVIDPVAGFRTQEYGGSRWRIYTEAVHVPDTSLEGWVQVTQALGPVEKTLSRLMTQFIIGLPAALLLAGVSGVYLAFHALHPIENITRTAKSINESDLTQRINHNGPDDEIGRLAATFDKMLERLQRAFERQLRFTGDAAHELRTPLAILKARIDITRSQTRDLAEYVAALEEMDQQVNRLIQLIQRLLFMARIDRHTQVLQRESIAVSEFIREIADQVMPLAAEKNIKIQDIPLSDLMLYGDMDLLMSLFFNLLDNAIKYTPVGGEVTITIQGNEKSVSIAVHNSGPGISQEHLPHLFERFYRVEADRTRSHSHPGGSGLGLSIAYEIAHMHDGTLTVESVVERGSMFTVTLPRRT